MTYPDDGYHPATETWPGGHRYGLQRIREQHPYNWSDEDRYLAHLHHIALPTGLGWYTGETWWDQPEPTMVSVTYDEATGTYSQTARQARKYAEIGWEHDPLKAVRPARGVRFSRS